MFSHPDNATAGYYFKGIISTPPTPHCPIRRRRSARVIERAAFPKIRSGLATSENQTKILVGSPHRPQILRRNRATRRSRAQTAIEDLRLLRRPGDLFVTHAGGFESIHPLHPLRLARPAPRCGPVELSISNESTWRHVDSQTILHSYGSRDSCKTQNHGDRIRASVPF